MAILAGLGNYIKLPLEITGTQVVGKNVTWYVFDASLVISLLCRVTNYDRVVDNDWW